VEVLDWLRTAVSSLGLDIECLIISLALLERVAAKKGIRVTEHTFRRSSLVAIALAAKTWYDGAVYNVDAVSLLRDVSIKDFNHLEASFLAALDYEVNVSVSLFARYFFALNDVIRQRDPNGRERSRRRRTWASGDNSKPSGRNSAGDEHEQSPSVRRRAEREAERDKAAGRQPA